jgi:hypothetical protein
MERALAEELLAMAAEDLRVRERLERDGSLFEGYHPKMRAVHERNADRLAAVIAEHGWPGAELVGAEAAQAAWLIVQHAISRPALMRSVLVLLTDAGGVPRWQAAMLEDRICVFEGRAQRFGTAFDWDEQGEMSPRPIEEPEQVDRYRAEVGLPPLAQVTAEHRRQAEREPRPTNLAARNAEADAFAHEVGWR